MESNNWRQNLEDYNLYSIGKGQICEIIYIAESINIKNPSISRLHRAIEDGALDLFYSIRYKDIKNDILNKTSLAIYQDILKSHPLMSIHTSALLEAELFYKENDFISSELLALLIKIKIIIVMTINIIKEETESRTSAQMACWKKRRLIFLLSGFYEQSLFKELYIKKVFLSALIELRKCDYTISETDCSLESDDVRNTTFLEDFWKTVTELMGSEKRTKYFENTAYMRICRTKTNTKYLLNLISSKIKILIDSKNDYRDYWNLFRPVKVAITSKIKRDISSYKIYNHLSESIPPECFSSILILDCVCKQVSYDVTNKKKKMASKELINSSVCQDPGESYFWKMYGKTISKLLKTYGLGRIPSAVRYKNLELRKKLNLKIEKDSFNVHFNDLIRYKYVCYPQLKGNLLKTELKYLRNQPCVNRLQISPDLSMRDSLYVLHYLSTWIQALGIGQEEMTHLIQALQFENSRCSSIREECIGMSLKSPIQSLFPRISCHQHFNKVLESKNYYHNLLQIERNISLLEVRPSAIPLPNIEYTNVANIYEYKGIRAYRWFEPLQLSDMLQHLLKAEQEYICRDTIHCPWTNSLLLRFHNNLSEYGINTHIWKKIVKTSLCFRDYCKFVIHEAQHFKSSETNLYNSESPDTDEEIFERLFNTKLRSYSEMQLSKDEQTSKKEILTTFPVAFKSDNQRVQICGTTTVFQSYEGWRVTVDNVHFVGFRSVPVIQLRIQDHTFTIHCKKTSHDQPLVFHMQLGNNLTIVFQKVSSKVEYKMKQTFTLKKDDELKANELKSTRLPALVFESEEFRPHFKLEGYRTSKMYNLLVRKLKLLRSHSGSPEFTQKEKRKYFKYFQILYSIMRRLGKIDKISRKAIKKDRIELHLAESNESVGESEDELSTNEYSRKNISENNKYENSHQDRLRGGSNETSYLSMESIYLLNLLKDIELFSGFSYSKTIEESYSKILAAFESAQKCQIPLYKVCSSRLHKYNYLIPRKSNIYLKYNGFTIPFLWSHPNYKLDRYVKFIKCIPNTFDCSSENKKYWYDFKFSLPTGLIVYTIPACDSKTFNIKQKYVDIGPICQSIANERSRTFRQDGTIVITKNDNTIEILSPRGKMFHVEIPFVFHKTLNKYKVQLKENTKSYQLSKKVRFVHRLVRTKASHLIKESTSLRFRKPRGKSLCKKLNKNNEDLIYFEKKAGGNQCRYCFSTLDGREFESMVETLNKKDVSLTKTYYNKHSRCQLYSKSDGTIHRLSPTGQLITDFSDGTRITSSFITKQISDLEGTTVNVLHVSFNYSRHIWIYVDMIYTFEHPNYVTVTYNTQEEKTSLFLPYNTQMNISKLGHISFSMHENKTKIQVMESAVTYDIVSCQYCKQSSKVSINVDPLYKELDFDSEKYEILKAVDTYDKMFTVCYNGQCCKSTDYVQGRTNMYNCSQHDQSDQQELYVLNRDLSGHKLWDIKGVRRNLEYVESHPKTTELNVGYSDKKHADIFSQYDCVEYLIKRKFAFLGEFVTKYCEGPIIFPKDVAKDVSQLKTFRSKVHFNVIPKSMKYDAARNIIYSSCLFKEKYPSSDKEIKSTIKQLFNNPVHKKEASRRLCNLHDSSDYQSNIGEKQMELTDEEVRSALSLCNEWYKWHKRYGREDCTCPIHDPENTDTNGIDISNLHLDIHSHKGSQLLLHKSQVCNRAYIREAIERVKVMKQLSEYVDAKERYQLLRNISKYSNFTDQDLRSYFEGSTDYEDSSYQNNYIGKSISETLYETSGIEKEELFTHDIYFNPDDISYSHAPEFEINEKIEKELQAKRFSVSQHWGEPAKDIEVDVLTNRLIPKYRQRGQTGIPLKVRCEEQMKFANLLTSSSHASSSSKDIKPKKTIRKKVDYIKKNIQTVEKANKKAENSCSCQGRACAYLKALGEFSKYKTPIDSKRLSDH